MKLSSLVALCFSVFTFSICTSAQDNPQAEMHRLRGAKLDTAGNYKGALLEYDEAIRLDPALSRAYYDKGIVYYEMGHYADSVANYRQAIKLSPENWIYHYNLGNTLKEMGKIEAAIDSYKKAKTLAPEGELRPRQNLGSTYCEAKHQQEAVAEFEELLKIDDDWNMARPCLAKSLLGMGKTEQALEVYKEFLRREPMDADVWAQVVNLYEGRSDFKNSEAAMRIEISIREQEKDPHLGTRLYIMAGMYQFHGHIEEAKSVYLRAIDVLKGQPNSASMLKSVENSYARLLADEKKKDAPPASAIATKPPRISTPVAGPVLPPPQNPHEPWWQLIQTARRASTQKHYPEAIDLYKQAAEVAKKLGPQDMALGNTLHELAILYQQTGQIEEQKEVLNEYVEASEKQFGKDSVMASGAYEAIANLYSANGDQDYAIKFEERALDNYVSNSTDRDSMSIQAMTRLAYFYKLKNKKDERIEPLLLRSVKAAEEMSGKDDIRLADPLRNLAIYYFDVRHLDKTEELYRRILKIEEGKWGADSKMLQGTLYSLGDLMHKMGKPEDAKPFETRLHVLEGVH